MAGWIQVNGGRFGGYGETAYVDQCGLAVIINNQHFQFHPLILVGFAHGEGKWFAGGGQIKIGELPVDVNPDFVPQTIDAGGQINRDLEVAAVAMARQFERAV